MQGVNACLTHCDQCAVGWVRIRGGGGCDQISARCKFLVSKKTPFLSNFIKFGISWGENGKTHHLFQIILDLVGPMWDLNVLEVGCPLPPASALK